MRTYLSIFLLMLAGSMPAQVTTFPNIVDSGNIKYLESARNAIISGVGSYSGGMASNASLVVTGNVSSVVVGFTRQNSYPGLTRLPNGTLICVYRGGAGDGISGGGVGGTIYYKLSTDQGNTWGAELTLYDPGLNLDARDPEITTLRNGKVIVSWFNYNGTTPTNVYVSLGVPSYNGTITWSSPIVVTNSFTGWAACSSKVIELHNGILLLPIYGINTGATLESAAVVKSINGGITWGNTVVTSIGGNPDGDDAYTEANGVVLANGRIVILMRHDHSPSNPIARVFSDDDGATWSSPTNVFAPGGASRPTLTRMASGKLFWMGRSSSSRTAYSTSTDSGVTWSSPVLLTTENNLYCSAVLLSGDEVASVYSIGTNLVDPQAKILFQTFVNGFGFFSSGHAAMNSGTVSNKLTVFGNLGIGTNNPDLPLTINSAVPTPIHVEGAGTALQFIRVKNTGSDALFGVADSSGAALGTGALPYSVGIGSLSATPLHLLTFDNVRVTVALNGNVGIGTNVPATPLHVFGASTFGTTYPVRFPNDSVLSAELPETTSLTYNIYRSGGVFRWRVDGGGVVLNGNGGDFRVSVSGTGLAGAEATTMVERFTLLNTGNVGIGTTTPTNVLDVQGHASIRTNLYLPGLPTNASPIAFLAVDGGGKVFETAVPTGGGSSSTQWVTAAAGSLTVSNALSLAGLEFNTFAGGIVGFSNTVSGTLSFYQPDLSDNSWTFVANVGIGTASASSGLDVPGDVHIGALIATNATIPILNVTTLNANSLNLTNALGSNQVRLAITNLTDVSVPGRVEGDTLLWNPTMFKYTNGQSPGGFSVSGNSNQIPFLNVAGTGFLFGSHDKSNPGFGMVNRANGNIGAMLIHVDKDEDIGLVQIGPPNPAGNISTFVPSLSITNRYAGDGQTTQEMVRVNFVDVDSGSSAESFIQTWRSWVSGTPPASTLVSYAAALRKDGQLMVAHGTFYPSNSLAATMPTAAQLGPGGYWLGNSNASLVSVYSLNGTTTAMKVLAP